MNPDIRNRIGQGLDADFATELHKLDESIDVGEVNFFLTALKANLDGVEEGTKLAFKNLIGEGISEDQKTPRHEIYRAILIQYYTHYTHEIEEDVRFKAIEQRIEPTLGQSLTPRQYFDNYAFDALKNLEELRNVDVDLQIWVAEKTGQLDSLITQIKEEIERTGFLKKEHFKFKVNDLLTEQTPEQKAARKQKRIEFLTEDLKQDQRFINEAGDLNQEVLIELKSRIEKEVRAQEEKENRAEEETRSIVRDLEYQIKDENREISDEELDALVSEKLLVRTKELMQQGVLERMMEERAKGSYNDDFDPIADYKISPRDEEALKRDKLTKISLLRKYIRETIVEVAQDSNIVSALPFIGSDIERENAPELGAEAQYTFAQDAAARRIGAKFRQNKVEKATTAAVNIQKVFLGFVARKNTSAFQGTENADAKIGKAGIVVAALRQLDGYTDHKGHWIDMPEGKTLQELLKYESNGYGSDPQNTRNLELQEQCKEELVDALAKPHESLAESFGDFYRIRNIIKEREQTEQEQTEQELLATTFDGPELLNHEERLYNKLLRQMPGLEFVFSQIDDNSELKRIYSKNLHSRSSEENMSLESRLAHEEILLRGANQIRKWAGVNKIRKWAGVNIFEPIEIEDLQDDIEGIQEQLRNIQRQIDGHNVWDEGEHEEISKRIRVQNQRFQDLLLEQSKQFEEGLEVLDTILEQSEQFQEGLEALGTRVQNLGVAVNALEQGLNARNRELDALNRTSQDNQIRIQQLEERNQDLGGQLQQLRDQLPDFKTFATKVEFQELNDRLVQEIQQTTDQIDQLRLAREREENLLRGRVAILEQELEDRIRFPVQNALAANNPQQPAAGNGFGGFPMGMMGVGGIPGEINVHHHSVETDEELRRIKERLDALNRLTEQQTQLLQQRLDASERATTALTNSLGGLRVLVQASATQERLDAAVAAINQSITGPRGVQETLLARINAINADQTLALQQARTDLELQLKQLAAQLTAATEEQARQLQEVRDALQLELAGVNQALERSEAQRAIDARRHEDNLRDTESRLKTGLDSMFASLTSDNEALREQIEKQREDSKKKERESLDPEGLRKLIAKGVLRDNLMPTIMGGAAGATLTKYGEPIFSYSGIEAGNLLMSHANAAFDNWDTSARDENSTYTSLTGKQRNPLISIAKLENRPVPGGDVPVYCVLKVDHEGVGQTFISEATFIKEIDKPLAVMHAKKTKSVKEAFARGEIPSLKDSLLDGVALDSSEERLMKKIYDKVSKENALAAEVEADKALIEKYREIINGIKTPVFDDERQFRLDLLNKGKFKELRNSLVYGNGDFRVDLFLGVGQGAEFADKWDVLNTRKDRGLNNDEIVARYQGIIGLVVDDDTRYDLQALLADRNFGNLRDRLIDVRNGNIREDLFYDITGDPVAGLDARAQRLLNQIKFGEVGLTKLMQEYSEQNYPIILKTLEEEHQRLDNVIKNKEQNLLTQGETDFVKDKYRKIIDMMADRPLKEDMDLVLQGPNGPDLVLEALFAQNPAGGFAHECIFEAGEVAGIVAQYNALVDPARGVPATPEEKSEFCELALNAIDTERPTKLQMLTLRNSGVDIADALFNSNPVGSTNYTTPKYAGLFDEVVTATTRTTIRGVDDNAGEALEQIAALIPFDAVAADFNRVRFQNIINLMAERSSQAEFALTFRDKGADEMLQQMFEKLPDDTYANQSVFRVGREADVIRDYKALIARVPAVNRAGKDTFCRRLLDTEIDTTRPTKRQMQHLLDTNNFGAIENALFTGDALAGFNLKPEHPNLFETINRNPPVTTITNVVNRDGDAEDLARLSVNLVEKAAHVANFMGSRGAQVERAKRVELQTAIDRIIDYPARVVAGDMTPINHDGLVTKVLKDNKLVDKVAQESANKVSAVYNEGFFANRAEIAKIRTQEGAALNPEEKRRMLEKSSALGSVLDLKFESSTFQGTSFLRPSRNQFTVMFNGDFGEAGSVNKCGFTQDIAYVPVPGGHKAFMRARVCTSDNLEARNRTGKDGSETYYVLSVYKKGVLSEEEHRVGDVVMDYDTVFHLTKRKDGTPKYEPVSLGSVKESVFQGAAKTFNLVKGAATLLVPSILKPDNVDSSIKGEQEFGKREFAEIRQTVKNMQVLIGSTGNEGERAFSTMAQGEVINHTHGRRTYVKTFLRPGYDNSVRVHDRTALARDGERLEFKFDKDGNLSGGVTDDTIRITENGATHDYRGSSRFVDSKYLKMPGVNADIELFGKVSVVSHAADEKGTDKAGDVVFSPEIFYKILQGGREVILPVFERGTTTPTNAFKIHLREKMLEKDPAAVPPSTITDAEIGQKLEEMQNKFLGSASVSVSIKPWTAALDHTAAIEGGEWKLHAIKYDSKARDSVVEVEAGRNGTASSALKMDLLQALASKQAQAVAEALADLSHDATDAQKEAAKNIPDQDVKNGLDALRTGIGAASKKEIANLNKGILKTPPLECVLRGKAKPLPEIVTTKKHGVLRHAGRAMNRSKNNIRLGLADDSRSR